MTEQIHPFNQVMDTPIEYLKGVGPVRAELLKNEMGIHSVGDLFNDLPFRYIDRSVVFPIKDIKNQQDPVQFLGTLEELTEIQSGNRKRLVGYLRDQTGTVELVWFQSIKYLQNQLIVGMTYLVYGKVNNYKGRVSIPHPEMELMDAQSGLPEKGYQPVYSSTEKLTKKGLDAKGRRLLVQNIIAKLDSITIPETIPVYIIEKLRLLSRDQALKNIHFPKSKEVLDKAIARIKFEELFFSQLRLLHKKLTRQRTVLGYNFETVGHFFHEFYKNKLPFELTSAQKRVIKEIRADLGMGRQMNRLLQGDVGSGKTVVALMSLLIALDNGYQGTIMAPTEILAQQHFKSLTELLEGMNVRVALLTGSIKGKPRKEILKALKEGEIHILIGTHALLEEPVIFKSLGLAIIDEQHRFGVAQRARLWSKSKPYPPHILVMTATPIPRTLAMSYYGDLDVSTIDELPPGRKPVQTVHFYESQRPKLFEFMKREIAKGRQIYVVYPLIEESEKLDLANLVTGYENLLTHFKPPAFQISVVHGRMTPVDKEFEMNRFLSGKTHIMVATTVIEVGVNIPNASVMIIENTERFGLSQLHQLRGRVGRGSDQSYCILMTSYKLTTDAKTRIQTMVRTNNGFEIAEVDLRLRGPGEIEGTRQSGALDFKLANLATDGHILRAARQIARGLMNHDPELTSQENKLLANHLSIFHKLKGAWSLIS